MPGGSAPLVTDVNTESLTGELAGWLAGWLWAPTSLETARLRPVSSAIIHPSSMVLNKETPEEEWRAKLEPFEYQVLRKKGTEPRGGECTSAYSQTAPALHLGCR